MDATSVPTHKMDDYFIDLLDVGLSQDTTNSHLISGNLGLSDITVESVDNEGKFQYQLKVDRLLVCVCVFLFVHLLSGCLSFCYLYKQHNICEFTALYCITINFNWYISTLFGYFIIYGSTIIYYLC